VQTKWRFYIFICVFALAISIADYFKLLPFQNKEPAEISNEVESFKVLVVSEPEDREWNIRFVGKIVEHSLPDLIGAKILISTERHKNIFYGDRLKLVGKIEMPENFIGSTGREFDYIGYLEAKGISYRLSNPKISVVGHDPPSRLTEKLLAVKHAFTNSLDRSLSEPQSSLAAGILIDGKQSIDTKLQDEFKKAGIVHIVVLSGFNVTIIAKTIFKIFSLFLPRMLSIISASGGIILFALITGGTTTVIRASIMAIVALIAQASFRIYDPARALFLTGFVMIAVNPKILLNDPSFQLSFMATFSVLIIVPIFEDFFSFVPEKFGLRDLVSATTITQIFLLPLLIWMTGTISFVALPVNFIVLPAIPLAMLVSFITACVTFVSPIIALPFAFVAHSILAYILNIAHWSSTLKLAEVVIGNVSGIFILFVYVAMGFWIWKRHRKRI